MRKAWLSGPHTGVPAPLTGFPWKWVFGGLVPIVGTAPGLSPGTLYPQSWGSQGGVDPVLGNLPLGQPLATVPTLIHEGLVRGACPFQKTPSGTLSAAQGPCPPGPHWEGVNI